jgi:hypothetical protein
MNSDQIIKKFNDLKAARIQAEKILNFTRYENHVSVFVRDFYEHDDPRGPHIDISAFLLRHKQFLVEAAEKELQEIDKKCDKLESVLNKALASVDLNV